MFTPTADGVFQIGGCGVTNLQLFEAATQEHNAVSVDATSIV